MGITMTDMGFRLLSMLLVLSMAWPWTPVAIGGAAQTNAVSTCCGQDCACPPADCPCCIQEAPALPAVPTRTTTSFSATRELDRLAADLVRVTGVQVVPEHGPSRLVPTNLRPHDTACRGRAVLLQSCRLQT